MRGQTPCVAISGYYGFGNAGDEAVLDGIVASLRELTSDIKIIVLTGDEKLTKRLHPGVFTAHRYCPLQLLGALRECDVLISGGGSLLQDVSSTRSAYYYLGVLFLARLMRRKRVIYAQGIGPLNRESVRKTVKRELEKTDFISVRDTDSRELLGNIGIAAPKVSLVSDPAFRVKADLAAADCILRDNGMVDKPFISVFLRDWQGIRQLLPSIRNGVQEFCRQTGLSAVAVAMQDDEDAYVSAELGIGSVIKCGGDFRALKGVVSHSSVVLAMRLHSLIFAASECVPFVGLVYDPKVSSFCRSVAYREGILLADVEECNLTRQLLQVHSKRQEFVEQLAKQKQQMLVMTNKPAAKVKELIGL